MQITNNQQINNKYNVSYGTSNNKVVNLMYGYAEYKIDTPKFNDNFAKMTQKKSQKVRPKWLTKLINSFENIGENKYGITNTEFRNDITSTLYNLKKDKKYDKIIRSDYTNYV